LCCEYLEQYLDVEGLFRVPGSVAIEKRLYPALANPEQVNLEDEHYHDVACTFKHWLRHLVTPIFPYQLFDEAQGTIVAYQETGDVCLLSNLVAQLPPEHCVALQRILLLLKKQSDNSAINKMPAGNLSIVFGPTLLPAPNKDTPMVLLDSQEKSSSLIQALLEHYHQIFPTN